VTLVVRSFFGAACVVAGLSNSNFEPASCIRVNSSRVGNLEDSSSRGLADITLVGPALRSRMANGSPEVTVSAAFVAAVEGRPLRMGAMSGMTSFLTVGATNCAPTVGFVVVGGFGNSFEAEDMAFLGCE
jgi:hypothetical protein